MLFFEQFYRVVSDFNGIYVVAAFISKNVHTFSSIMHHPKKFKSIHIHLLSLYRFFSLLLDFGV